MVARIKKREDAKTLNQEFNKSRSDNSWTDPKSCKSHHRILSMAIGNRIYFGAGSGTSDSLPGPTHPRRFRGQDAGVSPGLPSGQRELAGDMCDEFGLVHEIVPPEGRFGFPVAPRADPFGPAGGRRDRLPARPQTETDPVLPLAIIVRALVSRPFKREIERNPVAPRKSEPPAQAVFAARVGEPDTDLRCADEPMNWSPATGSP